MNSNCNVEVSDDHRIQIIPLPDHSPSQSHEQTPAAASASPQDESTGVNDEITPLATSPAASPQDQNRGVNEMTPEELSDLKEQLYDCICWGDEWSVAQSIIDKYPNMVRIPLDDSRDTALHAAVRRWNTTFVEGLVKLMSPKDMQIQNSDGMLPVHLAALNSQNKIVQDLSSENVLDIMAYKDIERLFFMTINRNMFGIYSKELLELFEKLWTQVRDSEYKKDMELITQPSIVLFDAVKSGQVNIVKFLIDNNRELLSTKDPNNGWNLLHSAVRYRKERIFRIIRMEIIEHIVRAVDKEGNNILHLAAHLPLEFEELSSFRASIQMQTELAWFKRVERNVPPEIRTMRNKMGKRPIDVFYDEHKKLSEEIKDSAKGIAESGMLVATLVATVAFAAALTVPGDKTNAWFTVFILTNAVALFTSSASLLSFLSNYTSSRFAQSEFVKSLHPSLTFGRALLLISVAAMVVAFTAASFLIFDHTSKWVAYAVVSMGVFPILLFLLFQFSFFDDLLWSRYYRLSELLEDE